MALGDVGGVVTELVITCMTADSGTVSIAKGDALKLTGSYTVTNATGAEDAVFGQAMAASSENLRPRVSFHSFRSSASYLRRRRPR